MKLVLLLLLAGCQTSKTLTVEQCSPFIKIEPREIITEAGAAEIQDAVNLEKSACNCRSYFYGVNRIGPTSGVTRKPLAYCHQMLGNPPGDYGKLSTFLESVRQDIAAGAKKETK